VHYFLEPCNICTEIVSASHRPVQIKWQSVGFRMQPYERREVTAIISNSEVTLSQSDVEVHACVLTHLLTSAIQHAHGRKSRLFKCVRRGKRVDYTALNVIYFKF
jgi:hypothetical protein